MPFRDRIDAARQLAGALEKFRGSRPVILAIPRGAVAMGRVIADALQGELDVVLVRKIGAPGNPEFAIGAVDEQGRLMLGPYAQEVGADADYIEDEVERQLQLIRRRRQAYRPGQPAIALAGRTVIVVDDGLATGSTMIAALQAVRGQQPAHLVCAVPVAARDSLAHVADYADEVVCLATPRPFNSVGRYYLDFTGVTDEEVIELLAAPPATSARVAEDSRAATTSHAVAWHAAVRIPAGSVSLEGVLEVPAGVRGLVIFAHGSGSSRHSSRNQWVAGELRKRGFGTLLFDLLTTEEDRDRANRFDVSMLAGRLSAAIRHVRTLPACAALPIGLFGASTGAAAALIAAAENPANVAAVVSRGGRPDLAGSRTCSKVRTHTLLLVGGADTEVLELNRQVAAVMGEWAELVVVPGASHLFEEPGTLQQVAGEAADWFAAWL
ncbi:MAG: phosphoribosyltransferase [Gammaproteobacteria bacterium RIFCSPHIGHO2_12_FULL_63_22]|nr:MAG: phosphoribosyltransferase [Gammaproteobacteria bacterium RIFCSPHIGHO2_12_FULL_63_22]